MITVRKRISKIAAAAFILLGFPALTGWEPAADAAENTALTVKSETQASPGDIITLSVDITESESIAAIEFWLRYDSDKLTLTDVNAGLAVTSVTGGQTAIFSPLDTQMPEPEGNIYFQWDSIKSSLSEDGSVLELSFEVKETASGDIPITLSDAAMYDADFNEISCFCEDGTLSVSPKTETTDIRVENNTGTEYPAEIIPPDNGWTVGENTFSVRGSVPLVVVVNSGSGESYEPIAAMDNADGTYTFQLTVADEETTIRIYYRGDLDGNGRIQEADIHIARQIAAHLKSCENWQMFTGDFNEDGTMNVKDVGLIRRYVEENLP